jgi:hypothetical protein
VIEILRELFESNPEKSTVILNGKCSDCGCDTLIEITPTSGGFGLNGGALFKHSPDDYLVKCHDCYKADTKIQDNYKLQKRCFQFCKIADRHL